MDAPVSMSDPPDPSSILLYGILAAPEEDGPRVLRERAGVQGASLTLLPCDDLAVLASPLETPSALQQPPVDTALAYKEVIEAVYEAETLIPLRFGTWAHSPAEARTLVAERADACRTQLKRFEGNVEMGLRLTTDAGSGPEPPDDAHDAASGTAYLQARKQQHEHAKKPLETALRQYREAVAPHVVDSMAGRPEEGTLSAAFLVPRRAVAAFTQAVSEGPDAAVDDAQVVGPWAPFTFASLSLRPGAGTQDLSD